MLVEELRVFDNVDKKDRHVRSEADTVTIEICRTDEMGSPMDLDDG